MLPCYHTVHETLRSQRGREGPSSGKCCTCRKTWMDVRVPQIYTENQGVGDRAAGIQLQDIWIVRAASSKFFTGQCACGAGVAS